MTDKPKPVMYIFINRGLKMSVGKVAAQAAHAAVEAYQISDEEMIDLWYQGGHYTKLVMLAESEEHLSTIREYIESRGFRTALIIDEGRTEISPHSKTALGVEIVDKNDEHVFYTFETFSTYKDSVKKTIELEIDR